MEVKGRVPDMVKWRDEFERNTSPFPSFFFLIISTSPPVPHIAIRQRPAIHRNPFPGHCPNLLSDLLSSLTLYMASNSYLYPLSMSTCPNSLLSGSNKIDSFLTFDSAPSSEFHIHVASDERLIISQPNSLKARSASGHSCQTKVVSEERERDN